MKTRPAIWLATSAAVALGAAGALRGDPGIARNQPTESSSRVVQSPVISEQATAAACAATASVAFPIPHVPTLLDEISLMQNLDRLGESDPAVSLRLARDGNARFPRSADAAQRAWIVVKALVNMKRFEEAKNEASVMVDKYRGTTWAADVARHLLVNPL